MTFTYRVFYEDDSRYNYGKIKNKQLGILSEENSAFAIYKSVYDK